MIPVKICGITNLADAELAVEHGTSAIGFIFYEKSPRAITIQAAKYISERLSASISKVGVFVNHTKDYIARAISSIPLDAIQLHGDESPKFCDQFALPVFKALRIKNETSLRMMDEFNVEGFLLDSFSDNQYGGTGKPFDWSILKKYQHTTPIILSGGLTPDNIIDAIQEIYPSAVDVNSGVESSPGEKNHEKINYLFNQLKETENTGFHFG